jgi:glycosyltransferase involved in cell wall biosynthesis
LELPLTAGFFDYLTTAGAIGLTHLLVSPYYLAFHHQHKSKELIRDLAMRFPGASLNGVQEKIALFTDTLDDINGVAITIQRLIGIARERGVHLTVITSGSAATPEREGVRLFPAVGDFTIPEYPELKLNFPPILDVMDFIEREGFTHIHVSTPGTVGLLGLLIGRVMDIPVAGTYHTDIPPYVRSLTNDEFLEKAAWNYMVWFYNQMGEVMVPSAGTRDQLLSRGLPAAKLKPLPRWVNTEQFSPERKTPGYWEGRGLNGSVKLLYVGRVSREKSLDLLVSAFRELVEAGADLSLAIIGDGPYREEMVTELAGYPVHFTGYLHGEELQRAYASADLFIFPSATDTFGNVVLEAQASGLPVIVTDAGGPRELMIDGETGAVFSAGSRTGLVEAVRRFTLDSSSLAEMGRNARAFTIRKAPDAATTYGAILHPGTVQPSTENIPAFAAAA